MREHICFEGIGCTFLEYVADSKSWVCTLHCFDLRYVDTCVKCRFDRRRKVEELIAGSKKRALT